jgi:hypothetical protein
MEKLKMEKKASLLWKIKNLRNLARGFPQILAAKVTNTMAPVGYLNAKLIKGNGDIIDYGLVSTRMVTTAFCEFLAAQLITDSSAIGDFKYHETGTDDTPGEAVGDVGLQLFSTEMVGDIRAVGTQVQGASAVGYKSVATVTYDGTGGAIVEHGLFNNTRASGGTLMDRSVFAAINVVSGDSIAFTYELTLTAGG